MNKDTSINNDQQNKACQQAKYISWHHLKARILLAMVLMCSIAFGQSTIYYVNAVTNVIPPVNRNLNQLASSGSIRSVFTDTEIRVSQGSPLNAYFRGRIERLSPSPFSITVSNNYIPQIAPTPLLYNTPVQLNYAQIADAFGNFNINNLTATGINISSILDANNNIILPQGTYRICFFAEVSDLRAFNYFSVSNPALGCGTFVVPPNTPANGVVINTRFTPPANPNIVQAITRGNIVPTLLFNNPGGPAAQVKIFGKIEALSPKPFSISLRPDYNLQQPLNLNPSVPLQLNANQVSEAFGNFNENDLITSGIGFNELKDANNVIKLPEGLYRVCFYARYFANGALAGGASNVNIGCATFNICYKASAPQFTQPISNFDLNNAIPLIRIASSVIFTWTPPIATCGVNMSAIGYDLEIREMFSSQTITDAINNPPVFTKMALRSNTFLLDTLLYKQVLQRGKLYVIRVKANSPINAPIEIDNNGFSRIQAFRYGDAGVVTAIPITQINRGVIKSTIATSTLKGKAVWSFKKAEEEFAASNNNALFTMTDINKSSYQGFNLPGKEKVEGVKQSIDPNLRIAAIQTAYITNNDLQGSGTPKVTSPPATQSTAPAQILLSGVSGDGFLVEKKDLKIAAQNGNITHPLAGAKVFLKGVKTAQNNQTSTRVSSDNPQPTTTVALSTQLAIVAPAASESKLMKETNLATNISSSYLMMDEKNLEEDLIASGTTDAAGNFVIQFIDPKFRNITKYSKLHVVIEQEDFENYSQFISIAAATANGDIDLGDAQLLAKTYRFAPYVEGINKNTKVDLYCPTKTFNANPHYEFMVGKSGDKQKKTIAGREYTRIAVLKNGEIVNKLFYQGGSNDNFILQINSDGKEQYTSYLGVTPVKFSKSNGSSDGFSTDIDESKMVMSIKKKYTLINQLPFISGKIETFIEDKNNNANSATIANKGAVITVSFDKSKVLEEYKENISKNGAPEASGNAGIMAPATMVNSVNKTKPFTALKDAKVKTSVAVNAPQAAADKTPASGRSISSSFKPKAITNVEIANQVHSLFRYSTVADEDGNYRIDKLPVLQDGAFFTVTVKSTDGMDSTAQTNKTLQRGDYQEMNFQFRPEVYTVTGIAVDESGNPLTDALLVWKSGGSPIEANKNGLFITSNYKDDSLTIKNQGYIDKTIFVKLDKAKQGKKSGDKGKVNKVALNTVPARDMTKEVNNWATTLVALPSVKASTAGAAPVSAGTFGYAVSKSSDMSKSISAEFAPVFNSIIKSDVSNAGFQDIGKVGYLEKGYAKINFVVSDQKTKSRISNAVITIDEIYDTTTNSSGEVLYRGGGSMFTYSVKGAAGSDYIVQTGQINALPTDGSITTVAVSLEHGIKLSGKITAKGNNLVDAEIFVEGKDYITTKSKSDGTYTLYVPKGESKVQVTKEKYVGKNATKNFTEASTQNFDLEDGGGKNIGTLLGFDIVLESHVADGNGEKWTGSFVNLKANTLFSANGKTKLKFSNVKVTFDAAGNPLVATKEVKTDVTEMNMKLFGYVPITIKGSPQITVREEVAGKGTIGGKLQLNIDQIAPGGGVLFDNYAKPLLSPLNSSIDKDVPVFLSDGSSPANLNFALSYAREDLKKAADKAVADFQAKVNKAIGESKATLQVKLNELKAAAASAASFSSGTGAIPASLDQYAAAEVYGFEALFNLAKSKVDASGLTIAGFLMSPDMPILSTMYFDLERLKIGIDFSIKDISVKSNLNKKFSIASWSAEINSVAFSMRGFKVGGKIEVKVPQSSANTMDFSDLAFGNSGLYGGSFTFPGNGLSIFNIVTLKTGGTPLSFGQIANTGVYKLGGSAKFSFAKLFTESIDVPYFQVQTDGKFGVTVPVNKSLDVGFAKFALNSVNFNTTTPSPQIDVNGQFSVDVKMLKFSAGSIHFKTTGVTIDKIGLGLAIPGTKVDGYVDIKENGFAGGGSLSVVGTPVKVAIDFHYFKQSNGGIDLGASFVAGVKIPIGPVIITKVGGGFTYRSNPEFFSVTITGGASVTGFEEAISLDPISITVESGPKIVGEAHLKVASLDVAKASLIIDIPNEYFAVGIVADFQPLPDIVKAHVQGDLIISTKSSDTYFFLGAGMNVDLLGLIKAEGVFALGVGVKDAKTRPNTSYYMKGAPDQYLNSGSFSGVYINALSEMGVTEQNAPSLDLGIVSGKIWLYNRSAFSLIANITNGNFRISASTSFEGGIKACIVKICASASAKSCVDIAGGFNDDLGWNFAARASGEASLAVGSDCGCNDICLGLFYAGGKICVGAGAKIRYESRKGGLKELSMFIGSKAKCN